MRFLCKPFNVFKSVVLCVCVCESVLAIAFFIDFLLLFMLFCYLKNLHLQKLSRRFLFFFLFYFFFCGLFSFALSVY